MTKARNIYHWTGDFTDSYYPDALMVLAWDVKEARELARKHLVNSSSEEWENDLAQRPKVIKTIDRSKVIDLVYGGD